MIYLDMKFTSLAHLLRRVKVVVMFHFDLDAVLR
jgi:hypothetical protein